jgi:N-acetyl-anhydromuramyl-L-alanine amidase AmpD
MLSIDSDGVIRDARIKVELIPPISHGPLALIDAIVVHQTDSSNAKGTLAGYRTGVKGTGAHFLIDKDGTIYQTVSIKQKCWHVGPIISKCYQKHSCVQKEEQYYDSLSKITGGVNGQYARAMDKKEEIKKYPDRYPSNSDAIGIEIVGKSLDNFGKHFEAPTEQQQKSLHWLIDGLVDALHLQRTDIYRHPQVSRKGEGEAADATW